MATYFINHVPSTGLVPWCVAFFFNKYIRDRELKPSSLRDFDAPDDGTRTDDTSAAMIAATGMLLLSSLERSLSPANTTGADFWNNTAIEVHTPHAVLYILLTEIAYHSC